VLEPEAKAVSVDEDKVNDLGSFLSRRFLTCKVGVRGLYYDAQRRILIIPHATQGYLRLPVEHRIRVEVRTSRERLMP
jgi:hypothetical protein